MRQLFYHHYVWHVYLNCMVFSNSHNFLTSFIISIESELSFGPLSLISYFTFIYYDLARFKISANASFTFFSQNIERPLTTVLHFDRTIWWLPQREMSPEPLCATRSALQGSLRTERCKLIEENWQHASTMAAVLSSNWKSPYILN